MSSNHLTGISLKRRDFNEILETLPDIGWFEIHSENYLHKHTLSYNSLLKIREHYPISMHGIALSLASSEGIDMNHLERIKDLEKDLAPFLISEHISWNKYGNAHFPDLFPLPYNEESLDILCKNIDIAQEYLGRRILIENPSTYIEFKATKMREADFLKKLCKKTGAGLLLDVNNIFVSCFNHNWDIENYLQEVPYEMVKEIHLAGHSSGKERLTQNEQEEHNNIKIDTHDNFVSNEVWKIYEKVITRTGNKPTLLEWDANIPDLRTLISEVSKAKQYMQKLELV